MTNPPDNRTNEKIAMSITHCHDLEMYERSLDVLAAKDREREEEINGIVDIIKEELNRSRRMFEDSRKIAPSSYGCGMDWGCVDTCERLLEEIKELITPTQE